MIRWLPTWWSAGHVVVVRALCNSFKIEEGVVKVVKVVFKSYKRLCYAHVS